MKKWGFDNEHSFWSVAISVGFYCLILGISIGSMFDKPVCTGSNFGCFEFWINRYQTLLTAFGVIFAVAIAKAQMDANRRQHVAQIKRSFKEELEILKSIRTLSNHVATTSYYEGAKLGTTNEGCKYYFWTIPEEIKIRIIPLFGAHLHKQVISFEENLHALASAEWYIISTPSEVDEKFEIAQKSARRLNNLLDREYSNISQYWS